MIQKYIDQVKEILKDYNKEIKIGAAVLVVIIASMYWFNGCGATKDPVTPTPEVPKVINLDSLRTTTDSITIKLDSVTKTIDRLTLKEFIEEYATND
jgi:hypothetical protein